MRLYALGKERSASVGRRIAAGNGVAMQNGSVLPDDLPTHDEVAATRQAVNERLEALFPAAPDFTLVEAAMAEAVRGSGKRLRPLLVIMAARDLGWPGPALDVGCALELVHTASLILDDLPCMDDAKTRRGKPAIHMSFGEDVANLASIALLTRAYGLLAVAPGLSADQRLEMITALSDAIGPQGLVGGQLEDLRGKIACAERAGDVNERKTAALFLAGARMACAMARSSEECRRKLGVFARQLGLAFQLLDDLLDVLGDPSAMGKPGGQDAGKPTLGRVLGTSTAQAHLRKHLDAAGAALAQLPNGGSRVSFLLDTTFRQIAEPVGMATPVSESAGPVLS